MPIFFTADTHFGHEAIIKMCNRPFQSIREHDDTLIANWNAIVRPNDIVYHIGDFAHRADPEYIKKVFSRLNGRKYLVIGNHDRKNKATLSLPWQDVEHRMFIAENGIRYVLDHYAGRSWEASRRSVQLFGHSHGRMPDLHNACDVGVDRWNFMPVTLPQIHARIDVIPPVAYEDESDDARDMPGPTPQ